MIATAVGVLVLAAVLIFARLDARLLWVDEAETALLGRSILTYGVPKAYDGKNLVSQEVGKDYDPKSYVWKWTPWLEKYVAAGSFAVFGESTFSARLPFALVGLLSVASMYALALALFGDRWVAVLSMAAMALSLPFLLYVRQCRYYSLVIFGSIWAVYFLVGLIRGQRRAVFGLVAAMTVVFHCNFLTFFALAGGLVPFALLLGGRRVLVPGAIAAGATILLNGPWMLYFHVFGRDEERLTPVATIFRNYLELTTFYTFPWLALALFLALAWHLRKRARLLDGESWRPFAGLVAIAVLDLAVLSTAPWYFYRYTLSLLPVFAVLSAFMCCRMLRWNRVVGALFTGILLLTGLFHAASTYPMQRMTTLAHREGQSFPVFDTYFPLGNYLYELSHGYVGPMESILGYLRAHARSGDRVFISYGDLILKFYTDYEVRGGQTGQSLEGFDPDWIVVRSFFRFGDRPHLRRDAEVMLSWLKAKVSPSSYVEAPFPVPDYPWDDIPEPQLHLYHPPTGNDRAQIFGRKPAS